MKALNLFVNQIKGGKCYSTVVSCNFDFLLERVHEGVTLIMSHHLCIIATSHDCKKKEAM